MIGYDGWHAGSLGLVFMGLFWLVLIGLLVWVVVALLSRGRGAQPGRPGFPPPEDTPEEILARRFAMGEINIEQYRQARAELANARQQRPPSP